MEEDSSANTPPSSRVNSDFFHDSAVELSQNDEVSILYSYYLYISQSMIELTGHVTSPYWQSSSGHFTFHFNKHYACNLAMNW